MRHQSAVFFSVGTRGNAIPTPFHTRICLLVYFSVFYVDM